MNSVVTFSLIFIIITCLPSCSNPKHSNNKDLITRPIMTKKSEVEVEDIDPYFTEVSSITSATGPRNITRNILQDKRGVVWMASWEGIISYDGTIFTNHTNKDSLRKFHVFSVFEDSAANIWFGTIGAGIYKYDGSTFTNYTTHDGLAHNSVSCFYEDSKQQLWIGTEGGISVYDGDTFKNYTMSDGLADNDTNCIVADNNGVIWIGSRGLGSMYDGTTFTKIINTDGRFFNNVRTIIRDSDGHMWLGGNDGLWKYDGHEFTNYTKDFVGFIFQDAHDRIWISTDLGDDSRIWALLRYDAMAINNPQIEPAIILQKENMFFGIAEDTDGGIWLGSLSGVCRYDGVGFDCFVD